MGVRLGNLVLRDVLELVCVFCELIFMWVRLGSFDKGIFEGEFSIWYIDSFCICSF